MSQKRGLGMHGPAIGRRLPPLHGDPIVLAIAEHACVLSHASIALTGSAARLRAATSLPYEAVDAIPKTSVGMFDKKALRTQYEKGDLAPERA